MTLFFKFQAGSFQNLFQKAKFFQNLLLAIT